MKKITLALAILISVWSIQSCSKEEEIYSNQSTVQSENELKLASMSISSPTSDVKTTFIFDDNDYLKFYTITSAFSPDTFFYEYDNNDMIKSVEQTANNLPKQKYKVHYKDGLVSSYGDSLKVFFYDDMGNLIKSQSTKDGECRYLFKNGNLVDYTNEVGFNYKFSYDDMKNPFYDMFPEVFGKTLAGFDIIGPNVNNNNIIKLEADGHVYDFIYTYNDQLYPTSLEVRSRTQDVVVTTIKYEYY